MDLLRSWFTAHGGVFHDSVVLARGASSSLTSSTAFTGPFGVSVLAPKLTEDTTVVTCPFALVITKDSSSEALKSLLGPDAHTSLDAWSERQLICSYLCFHYLCSETSSPKVLCHFPYVRCLPPASDLLTPLHFTPTEREMLRGTNLYGATLDRERDWRAEWTECQSLVRHVAPEWGYAFTWDVYVTASTYLSSRAFPSSILSSSPSLVASPSTYPVLIPGVDLLNHRRGEPVSWIVTCQDVESTSDTISLVAHSRPNSETTCTHDELIEVFNNYGPKPNDELILGYGFTLVDNPDDSITLQIGGGTTTSQKWVVGRNAQNAEGLWSEIRSMIATGDSEYEFEDDLETAAVLSDMVLAKLDGFATLEDVRQRQQVRPAVKLMVEHYIAGQRDIFQSILEFAEDKRQAAIETAREQGIDLVFDEDDDDR